MLSHIWGEIKGNGLSKSGFTLNRGVVNQDLTFQILECLLLLFYYKYVYIMNI